MSARNSPQKMPYWAFDQMGGDEPQKVSNLNRAVIPNADGPDVPLSQVRPLGLISDTAEVEPVFQDIESRLRQEIRQAPAVIGCMAWLTNKVILEALATRSFVSLLVQKEDWLRPDGDTWSGKRMLEMYSKLPAGERSTADMNYNVCGDPGLAPVRCVGTLPAERKAATARMHHKFMVFCRYRPRAEANDVPDYCVEDCLLDPYAVWTGSFNATENGTNSFENAVIIRSPLIAQAYLQEWRALVGVSEPLNWNSVWVQPEYRFGT